MNRAISLAGNWLHTHPNPRVGAVIVDGMGEVVGEGWHEGPGTDHAEVAALDQAGARARGGTVYVTLEPCTHHGRTPPCVEALLSAGVSRVVIATLDPDERVSGGGVRRLSDAGIEVVTGVGEDPARRADPAYFRHRETGMPMVTLKWAMTLDGSVAAVDRTSRWITSEPARRLAHQTRAACDAVVVGAGTVRADDPGLDVRLEGYEGPQPRPVIVAGRGELPAEARIWHRDPIVFSPVPRDIPAGESMVTSGPDGLPDPVEVCAVLADKGFLELLVEGGPTLAAAWWRAGVVTNGFVHIGARVGGGAGISPLGGIFATIADAIEVSIQQVRNVGGDVVIGFEKR